MRLRFLTLTLLVSAGLMLPAVPSVAGGVTSISGAGATFPYPAYARWAAAYHKQTSVKLNYQSIGSGGGIKQIRARTVDFGASDAPLEPAALREADLVQFPMIVGGVVPVVNVLGIAPGQLHLDGPTLAEIFLGRVTRWNDARLTSLNPGLALPDQAITIVHRADGSGTSWIFTDYLTKVSHAWKETVGRGKAVAWPAGVGGKGNEGVASYVERIKGAIGYVEYAYALQNHMAHVSLKNREGRAVVPSQESFQAAAAGADWAHAEGFYLVLTNQPGEKSWPITGASFILLPRHPKHPKRTRAVLTFLDWAYRHGGEMAASLDYVPIPRSVYQLVESRWRDTWVADSGPLFTPANP